MNPPTAPVANWKAYGRLWVFLRPYTRRLVLVLVVSLVPTLGIPGAAWAAFGTESVNMALQLLILRSLTKTPNEQPVYEVVSLEPNCE